MRALPPRLLALLQPDLVFAIGGDAHRAMAELGVDCTRFGIRAMAARPFHPADRSGLWSQGRAATRRFVHAAVACSSPAHRSIKA